MIRVLYPLLFSLFLSAALSAEEPKKLKTLILIIATDDKPAYRELQKIWEAYMNSDPAHFEAYFIRANPDLPAPYEIGKNEITVKTEESFIPGIINKTILSMEVLEQRLKEFDYVLRTNLSSFFPFNNLLNYLAKLPKKRCYCGISLYTPEGQFPDLKTIPFISGAGIILSTDLVKSLIKERGELEKYKSQLPDDVFIGLFCRKKKIPMIPSQRWDYPTYDGWLKHNYKIEEYAYHFRAKYSYNARTAIDPYGDELLTLKALLKRYYPTAQLP